MDWVSQILREQLTVGEMVVGRVTVEVSMYDIVPRSNCWHLVS
jgi:hypothetical protein